MYEEAFLSRLAHGPAVRSGSRAGRAVILLPSTTKHRHTRRAATIGPTPVTVNRPTRGCKGA